MTDYVVLFDGTPNRPLGRLLFAEEWPRPSAQPLAHYNSRPQKNALPFNLGRRVHPVCEMPDCARHVEQPTDRLCRVCVRMA